MLADTRGADELYQLRRIEKCRLSEYLRRTDS